MTVRPSTQHNIQRDDENTNRPGFAVVQKILVTGSISMQYTGIDPGTGDVTLFVTGTGGVDDDLNIIGYIAIIGGAPAYPSANKGDAYIISGSGLIGGAFGKTVNDKDLLYAIQSNGGGTEASVGQYWSLLAAWNRGVTNGDSHDHDGGDGGAIREGSLGLADVTTANATISRHGFLPKLSGNMNQYLNGSGSWSIPSGTLMGIWDEGVLKGHVNTFDFIGSPVDVSVSGSIARIFITGSSGGGGGVQLSTDSPRVYTNSGTWSKPAGLQYVIVEVVGGGGGSGAAEGTTSQFAIGGPGGGGEYAKGRFDAGDLGATENISIGRGGVAGATPSGDGGNGGTSSFGSHITALGGSAGAGQTSSATVPRPGAAGGAGGSGGSGGDIRVSGNAGQNGLIFPPVVSSIGGGNPLGGSSRTSGSNIPGQAGSNYGGGAAGAVTNNNNTDRDGAAGGDGVVIVWEYVSV